MKNIFILIFSILSSFSVYSQVPAPGAQQSGPILITNGTAHIGDGTVIEDAVIAFDNGKITLVSKRSDFTGNESSYQVIDALNKHIYPGFILPNTDLGLREVNAVRATVDASERGDLKPSVRSIPAYNTDSELIPTLRFNGVLVAQIAPQGGTITGTSSVVHLDAWNWEDAVIKTDNAIHINWPRKKLSPRWWMGETAPRKNENYEKAMAELKNIFRDAKAYSNSDKTTKNLKLEAILGTFDGSKKVFVTVNKAKQIIESIEFLKKQNVRDIVLVGANDINYVKEYVKENDIPVVLNNLHRKPSRSDEDVDLPFRLPAILSAANIKYCLGYQGVANARNLAFIAGTSVAYGLDKELAIKSITLDAAEIIGVSGQLGSLESGKDATLFISEGDALDMKSNEVSDVFINGRKVELKAMQQRLYEKYYNKYNTSE